MYECCMSSIVYDECICMLCTDIEVLHLREDWRVQAEEGSVITSLVSESFPIVALSPHAHMCSSFACSLFCLRV